MQENGEFVENLTSRIEQEAIKVLYDKKVP